MAKNKILSLMGLIALAGILASIAVGMAIVNGVLSVPFFNAGFNTFTGWLVVVGGALKGLKEVGIMK